jgi:hypothetical protein
MSTPFEGPTPNAQETKGAKLEQEQSSLQEELTEGRVNASPVPTEEEQARPQTRARPHRSSRRKMLTKGMGVAAVASVGAGALLQLSSGTALASGPGVFTSSKAGTPAVKATGTKGADGVDAKSDSGIGVSATSTSGTGLVATSSTGLAAHFVGGNVTMDKNLTVTGTLSSGAGTFAAETGVSGFGTGSNGTGVFGTGGVGISGSSPGVNGGGGIGVFGISSGAGGTGVEGQSSSGVGVEGQSSSGTGVSGVTSSGDGVLGVTSSGAGIHGSVFTGGTGLAGLFDGNVKVNGNFSATGTKSFVQAHPTDASREIVYVALEGGEAGTYVRGSGQLQGGKAVLTLPEHFGLVTATSGLTVQLTPRGEWLQLYVAELDTAQLVVREAQGKSGVFDYFICGVRSGYEQYEVIRTKR